MKVLIVDDSSSRYEALIVSLKEKGMNLEDIVIANSSSDAISKLEDCQFDLMILDLLLPKEKWENQISSQNSMDLIKEITVGDDLLKPGSVVGLTSDLEASKDAVNLMDGQGWKVVKYEQNKSSWLEIIGNLIKYQKGIVNNSATIEVDLLVICALRTPELKSVLCLPWEWELKEFGNEFDLHIGSFHSGGKRYTVGACHASKMGMVATSSLTAALIARLNPKVVAMTGICAGIRGKTALGDLIYATSVWDYQTGKRMNSPEHGEARFLIDPHQIHAASDVGRHISKVAEDSSFLLSLVDKHPESKRPQIHTGPIASGSAVIADSKFIEDIIQQNRKVLGVEMEIYGLYFAAHEAFNPPKVFSLKGVCDHGDETKEDGYQAYASDFSALTLKKLMEDYGSKIMDKG
ncbi:phosphorylase family protein [Marinomonas colpomeniae]|uniref:Response regulatory domain-containing protein n=1 Tax=Marinomonas colpomeniae TaxID=2774408 RepID=A0ABR8P2Z0_9GAMM|nr:hypothetical protein [Marinomonas colpomeniae]MBD5772662.1 hypothetical protein [Marinomonas colpomeniae]